jgi:hypothetical protein
MRACCPIPALLGVTIGFAAMQPADPTEDLTAASVLAVLAFLVFAGLVAAILTDTVATDDRAVAWVGAGLVGLGSLVLSAWAIVLYAETELPWEGRLGDDLAIAGSGFFFVIAGLPTFVAGVI